MTDLLCPLRRLAPVALLVLLAGCSGPRGTIREFGFPAFEPVVGATTQFERLDPRQTEGLDAFTDGVRDDVDHTFAVRYWPLATEERVAVEVKARATDALRLEKLALVAYPVQRNDAERFRIHGTLPADVGEPLGFASETERDEDGNVTAILLFDRAKLPEGTERLAIPTLAQFEDGWIHVRFYQTGVPAPLRVIDPSELPPEQRPGAAAEGADGGESPSGEEAAPIGPAPPPGG